MRFHDDCLVVDGHTDVPTRLWELPADLGQRLTDRHVDLPRLRDGGVDALVCALYVPAGLAPEEGLEHALALHEATVRQLAPGRLVQAGTVAQIREAVARGEVAVVLALENGRPLLVPGALARFARLGVRYVTLTHVASHEWCDASTDEPRHGGLSDLGVKLVREMSRTGIVPDVSHASDAAVEQVLEVSATPILASHSSARALCDHPRNLPDALVREIARRDGVVMAVSYPAFVSPEAARASGERRARLKPTLDAMKEAYFREPAIHARDRDRLLAAHPLPEVPLAAFVDHVIHLVELGGEEHVGIGSDFDGISDVLRGFEDPSRFPDLTAALLERGVDRAGVRLILGENFLRVLERAERLAR